MLQAMSEEMGDGIAEKLSMIQGRKNTRSQILPQSDSQSPAGASTAARSSPRYENYHGYHLLGKCYDH